MQINSQVVVVITHYECAQWLEQCLISIVSQTRKPDAIVVVDDQSEVMPYEIVTRFPAVTLMRTVENGGPFRILQKMIERADYEVIMFQDADDWSMPTRLEILLYAAQKMKADLIGGQIEHFYEYPTDELRLIMPEDPRATLLEKPLCHSVFLGTAIVDRSFAIRTGGFSTGLKFGADSEFIRRAAFSGIVKNVPDTLYFRRIRQDSLTHNEHTGFGSPERIRIQKIIQKAGLDLVRTIKSGAKPNFDPICKGQAAILEHITGPRLRWIS